jgi:hypothetical protein
VKVGFSKQFPIFEKKKAAWQPIGTISNKTGYHKAQLWILAAKKLLMRTVPEP